MMAAAAGTAMTPESLPARLRERIADNTASAGLAAGRLAEAFQVVATG
jgi:hypothetical protein